MVAVLQWGGAWILTSIILAACFSVVITRSRRHELGGEKY